MTLCRFWRTFWRDGPKHCAGGHVQRQRARRIATGLARADGISQPIMRHTQALPKDKATPGTRAVAQESSFWVYPDFARLFAFAITVPADTPAGGGGCPRYKIQADRSGTTVGRSETRGISAMRAGAQLFSLCARFCHTTKPCQAVCVRKAISA